MSIYERHRALVNPSKNYDRYNLKDTYLERLEPPTLLFISDFQDIFSSYLFLLAVIQNRQKRLSRYRIYYSFVHSNMGIFMCCQKVSSPSTYQHTLLKVMRYLAEEKMSITIKRTSHI